MKNFIRLFLMIGFLGCVSLLSISALRTSSHPDYTPSNNIKFPSDSFIRIDSLQIVLDKNLPIISRFDSIVFELKILDIKISENQNEIKSIDAEQKTLIKSKTEILKALKCDSSKLKIDNCILKLDKVYEKQNKLNDKKSIIENDLEDLKKVKKELIESKNTMLSQYENSVLNLSGFTNKLNGSKSFHFRNSQFNLFVADIDSNEISMHLKDAESGKNFSSIGSLLNFLLSKNKTPLMITNAGMYTKDYLPQGLFIENKKMKNPLDSTNPKNGENFYLKPNGVFYLDSIQFPHIDTTETIAAFSGSELKKIFNATQSGPMLVINGRIHPSFTFGSSNRKIRSGVGIVTNKKVVFICSVGEVNFYDFAMLFKYVFNCKNSLFLDGAISHMYLPDIASNEMGGNFGPMISVTKK